jgi:hypothetical protein
MSAIYKIEIPPDIVEKSVDLALSKKSDTRSNFFHEIRVAFKRNLEKIFESCGLPVNPVGTLGYTNYLKQGVHKKWKPITKYTGWKNYIKKEMVCMLLPDYEVIHHYRGAELEGLELDIWIPELRLGIEYQGEQHYNVVTHWGGKEGLGKRIANDHKKKRLCKSLGYHLIEIKYFEEISEQLIKDKMAKIMGRRS